MIEQLRSITHVNGHIVQPSAITELEDVDVWMPRPLEIGIEQGTIHVSAESVTADALIASIKSVLGNEYEIGEPQNILDGCVSVVATEKETKAAGDSDNAAADT